MQAIYVLDQTVNINTAPIAWRDKCKPKVNAVGEVTEWIIPKGTVIDGSEALLRVSTGQCAPYDEECIAACGQSPDQLEVTQRRYLSAERGIKGKKDIELFMAGVIEGYESGSTGDTPVYLHGPNWDAWEQAKSEIKSAKDEI